jgi:TPP-dependent pyruvate/acetoin dehydrogenase alpha subunit
MGAPAILLCNNNGWAISTPVHEQTRAATLADKAAGYGMPGVRVDGGDVLAVYAAVRAAAERARGGEGPTFIEAVTYRMAPHATADDPSVYIDADRVEQEREHECVSRFEGYLRRRGLLDDALAADMRAQAMTVMREGIAEAEGFAPPSADLVFDTAFANPPAAIAADRAELRRILAGERP